MPRKLILLDIDGTLCIPTVSEPPASALEAIRLARRAGHLVALCSGRNYASQRALLAYGFDGVVASAGGYIVAGDEVLFDCPMTDDQRRRVCEALDGIGAWWTLESRLHTYADSRLREYLKTVTAGNSELLRWHEASVKRRGILPMEEYDGDPIYKITFLFLDHDKLIEPMTALGREFKFCLLSTFDRDGLHNAELINRKFNKGKALLRMAAHFGVAAGDTIAFGDSMNDAEMLAAAGLSVCMGNGSPELKEMADLVCPNVDDDGLYKAFAQLGLFAPVT